MKPFDSTDYSQARAKLCRKLRKRGLTDERVLAAIAQVPRERFVPGDLQREAYADTALPIGAEQTISQPFIVALMTQALQLAGDETILEIGTGSGYQAAVLSRLCRRVVTMERLPGLAEPAKRLLTELGLSNVEFLVGDGTLGCPALGPYAGILVTAAAPDVPLPLFEQLTEGGRLVLPVGDLESQSLLVVEKHHGQAESRSLCQCRFVKLIGAAGWQEAD